MLTMILNSVYLLMAAAKHAIGNKLIS